jgi:IclR family transcriptional regulator, acetate operon repressor
MGFRFLAGSVSGSALLLAGGGMAVGRRGVRRVGEVAARDPSQVQSLTRALGLLDTLAEAADGMSLSDVAQIVGLAPSTAHRLLTTLEACRYVRFVAGEGLWQVGVQSFVVGQAFRRSRNVVALARPFMRHLMEESGETVNLYIEEGGEAVCMAQVECRQLMRAIARPGGRVKLHCSGAGKAMLAHLSASEVGLVLQAHGLPRATERTLDTPRKLKADLELVRERGYAVDDEEHAPGLRCVAAPIVDEEGRPLAALSVSGPLARIDDAAVGVIGRLVRRAAVTLTEQIGGRASG